MSYKVIITIIIVIVCFTSVLSTYVNDYLLPQELKTKIIRALEKRLHKKVEIENLYYRPFDGIIMQNLTISDTARKLYAEAEKISFKFFILPLFQTKIIIPNIYFRDERAIANYSKEITDIKIGLSWNLAKQIKFNLQAKIPDSLKSSSLISATGKYNFPMRDLQARIKLEHMIIGDCLPYFKKVPVSIYNGVLNTDIEIKLKNKQLAVKGMAYIKGIEFKRSRFTFKGDIDIEPDIKYDLKNKTIEYKGRFGFSNAVFSGPTNYFFRDIRGIQGNIYFERNKIWSYGIKAEVLDSPIEIKGEANYSSNQLYWNDAVVAYKNILYDFSGNIEGFKQPRISLELNSKDLDLKTTLDVKNKVITINSCSGRYLNNDFLIKGKVDINDRSLNLETESNLSLREVFGFLPAKISNKLKKIKAAKDVSGKLNMKLNMQANIRNFLETLEAKGSAYLEEINLWEWNVFKGIGEILFIPMRRITFEDVRANFIIKNKYIDIIDSSTKSKQLNFAGKGKIGFNGSLDILLYAKINRDLIKEPAALESTSQNIDDLLTMRINGSLIKPQYKVAFFNKEASKLLKQLLQSY